MAINAVILFLWAVVAWRFRTVLQHRWKRAAWISLTALAVALSMGVPTVITVTGRVTGVPALAILIEYLAAVLACAAVLDWVAALTRPSRSALRGPGLRHLAAVAVIAAMATLFAVMHAPVTDDLVSVSGSNAVTAFLMVFFVYLGIAMTATAGLLGRASRNEDRRADRAGMILLAAGTAVAAVYAVARLGFLAGRVLGDFGPGRTGTDMINGGVALEYVAVALIIAGMSVPALGVAGLAARDLKWAGELGVMWRTLTRAVPDAGGALPQRSSAGAMLHPRVSLIRLTAEIRDAALALRYAVPPRLTAEARDILQNTGLTGKDLDVAAEACWLNLAVASASQTEDSRVPHILPGAAGLEDEARFLRRLGKAMKSKTVRTVAEELTWQRSSCQQRHPSQPRRGRPAAP